MSCSLRDDAGSPVRLPRRKCRRDRVDRVSTRSSRSAGSECEVVDDVGQRSVLREPGTLTIRAVAAAFHAAQQLTRELEVARGLEARTGEDGSGTQDLSERSASARVRMKSGAPKTEQGRLPVAGGHGFVAHRRGRNAATDVSQQHGGQAAQQDTASRSVSSRSALTSAIRTSSVDRCSDGRVYQ